MVLCCTTEKFAVNPAIIAAEELEVFVSGYPEPTASHITWQRPDQSIILSSDGGVSFQDNGKRLIFSNVQPNQAGLYECIVTVQGTSAAVKIQLNVYGEYT